MHSAQSDDVIDVRVRHHDGHDFEVVPLDHFQNAGGIVAGIDDDRFPRPGVTDNMAIALQHADRKDFVNQFFVFPHTPNITLENNIGTAAALFESSQMREFNLL
jgi:hypothetical protein